MKRLSSQLIIDTEGNVLRNSAVTKDKLNGKLQFFSIFENNAESAATIFRDGVLSPAIYSLSIRKISTESATGYSIINIEKDTISFDHLQSTFIIDFGTENLAEINQLIAKHRKELQQLSLPDLIQACCIAPAKLLNIDLTINDYIIWENVDLIAKKNAEATRISAVSFQ
jgi:hypothetical protein